MFQVEFSNWGLKKIFDSNSFAFVYRSIQAVSLLFTDLLFNQFSLMFAFGQFSLVFAFSLFSLMFAFGLFGLCFSCFWCWDIEFSNCRFGD